MPTVSEAAGVGQRSKPKRKTSGFVGRVKSWNKDVVCIPYTREKHIAIPRSKQRGLLAERGLIGKIKLVSTMTVCQIWAFH